MRIILSNGRQFIIKVKYTTTPKFTHTKDKFHRDIYTEWTEHGTMLSIVEWFKTEPNSKVVITGSSHCNYQDQFDKSIGRGLAYYRALQTMEDLKIINSYEAEEMASFTLDKAVFRCTKAKPVNVTTRVR